MKKALVVLAVLALTMSLGAQQRTGNIYGKITDAERNPLPGVTVTLSGPQLRALTTVTNEAGIYRFPSLSPGTQYEIKAELQGFKTTTQGNVIVTVGSNSEINLILEVGRLEEQVTVTAATPIVDTKKTATSMNVGKEELQSLPTARDPWVVMQLAPSIMLDRENVGGNESGQQASFLAKGDMSNNGYVGSDNLWSVDGIDITDPAALGGSALYYDFDMFEELNITTGGAADVTVQTGGIALNMVTRRGGNKMSLAGRFYLTDNFFQSTNLTDDLRAQGVVATNKIQQIKDYGFNAGGPLVKDKVWWWAAYGVQDIFTYTLYQTKDQTLLNNYNLKINAQLLANNRFEALVTSGAKEKLGRNASVAKPEGDHQQGKYHWGSPILKLQDEHVFGNNFYLSLKYSFNDAGFGWRPMTDESLQYPSVYDQTNSKFIAFNSSMLASWDSYLASRPRNNYQLNATYFNDTFLGLSHEVKIGAEYSHKVAAHHWGYFQDFRMWRNYNNLQIDADGDGTRTVAEMAGWQRFYFFREGRDNGVADQYSGYLQDTITKGNFTLMLGLRYDLQKPSMGSVDYATVPTGASVAWDRVFPSAVSTAFARDLPGVTADAVPGVDSYRWSTWSPRIGVTWDITGDGKTVAKLALSQYGDVMGTGSFSASPVGTGGNIYYWWKDTNGDQMVNFDEMFWRYPSSTALGSPYGIFQVYDGSGNLTPEALAALGFDPATQTVYGSEAYVGGNVNGFDWNDKTALDYSQVSDYFASKSVQSSTRTREILLTLEREIMPEFAASINLTYRRYDNYDHSWAYYKDTTGLIRDPESGPWYTSAGTIPSTINIDGVDYSTGEQAGKPYYLPTADYPSASTPYTWWTKGDDYNTYLGADLVLTKRLSNKWFANASFTWQNQKEYWGTSYLNPQNYDVANGYPYGQWGGGASGKVAVLMYTRWMAKLSGLYQLPYGFDISGTMNAREGWKIPHYFYIYEANSPNPNYHWTTSIYTQPSITDALPTFINVTLRIEKKINIGAGRLYFMADVFNLFNAATPNRAYDAYFGDGYLTDGVQDAGPDGYWKNTTYRKLNEILNPRIWRFGARFEF